MEKSTDMDKAIGVVYCDFMKAFERVPHQKLLRKLAAYGIEGQYITWIRKFFFF